MPSYKGFVDNNNQCIIKVFIGRTDEVFPPENLSNGNENAFLALIDTGASRTCVSNQIVTKLELIPTNKIPMQTAGGQVDTNVYQVNLGIPISRPDQQGVHMAMSGFHRISVSEFSGQNFDVLIGMDVLRECHFILLGNEFVLGF